MGRYEEIEENGLATRDKKYLLRHLAGEKLTPMQTIYAKCYECMGYFIDGKEDCGIKSCPNYPHMRYNPHRTKRASNLTDEQRVAFGQRMKKATAK